MRALSCGLNARQFFQVEVSQESLLSSAHWANRSPSVSEEEEGLARRAGQRKRSGTISPGLRPSLDELTGFQPARIVLDFPLLSRSERRLLRPVKGCCCGNFAAIIGRQSVEGIKQLVRRIGHYAPQ